MSTNYVCYIPTDPFFLPGESSQAMAIQLLATTTGSKIRREVWSQVQYVSAMGNHERVICPNCQMELTGEQWQEMMNIDWDDNVSGFRMNKHPAPCCAMPLAVNELIYEWREGFAKFCLSAEYFETWQEIVPRLEELLNTKLIVILQHI